jgi:hypothetical protein
MHVSCWQMVDSRNDEPQSDDNGSFNWRIGLLKGFRLESVGGYGSRIGDGRARTHS